MQTLIGMEQEDLRAMLGAGEPAFRAGQVFEALYARRVRELGAISNLPAALRARLAAETELGWPRQAARYESADGTRRYLLELADGRSVEAVFMPEESRDTLCISTQVGCPVACQFCLTARMGLERNLTAGEIVGQVLLLAEDNALWPQAKRINIVMMGMGEPLLNLGQVLKATRLLTAERGMAISPRRITVSTAGIVPQMAELGRAAVRPRLAVSLNASTEEQRCELMPITSKYSLAALIGACRAYPLREWESLTFEYVLLGGVNDTDADARRVVRLLNGLRAKVNLIALNPGPGIPFETPAAERVAAFQAIVRKSLPCFVRRPRGRDIYAACGQLKRMTDAAPGGAASIG
jgi:23S rRNA (adenine2503-C2)-methyltransferase